MNNLKNKKGFTLVELMIVVVIMGILVAVAVPVYGAVTKNAQKKTCASNEDIIRKAAAQYMMSTSKDNILDVFTAGGTTVVISSQADAEAKLDDAFLNCFDGSKFPICPGEGAYTLEATADSDYRTISVNCGVHNPAS